MNLVDSSAWLEYFADGPNADFFATPIEDTDTLLVSTINVYEVFKRTLQVKGETEALQIVAIMMQGQVAEITNSLALSAARISLQERLAMADAMIYATARSQGATLWTQDADFEGKPAVQFRPKGSPSTSRTP